MIECLQWNCYWVSNYNPATEYRGNVTQITSYANAASLTGAISETRRYDITGNMVKSSTSCCQETSYSYSVNTQYAYPHSETRGSATDPYAQLKTSATCDFNTGLGLTLTDANGRISSTTYDAATLRPTSAISTTGAHTDHAYNDSAMTITTTTYSSSGGVADQVVQYLNGRGQIRQEKALGPNSVWDIVDTAYNNMGQVLQQTRPYRSGETPQWSTTTYDALGRPTILTAPEGSTTKTFYNEVSRPDVASTAPGETTRVQDGWGRERWSRTDASGNLVEVIEPIFWGPGPMNYGGMQTTYTYNTLGNLTQIVQGSQTRTFKYDSLGRLTAHKLAEMKATLNDTGTYVDSGTWKLTQEVSFARSSDSERRKRGRMFRSTKLVLLSSLLVFASVTVGAQAPTWKPAKPTLNNCEMNVHNLDTAHHLAGDDSTIIAIAHLGAGERNPELNRRRLHNVRAYLTSFGWKRRPDTVVTAEGERVDGFGRVDIYVRGGHWASLAVRRNRDLIVGLCEPEVRSQEEKRTFYPFRDRKKP